jgi:hypothetical protein
MIQLARDRAQWWAYMYIVTSFRFCKSKKFLDELKNYHFLKEYLHLWR